MTDDFPSRSLDKFVLRLPEGLRERIANAAKANGRSMNAEIVRVLDESFPPPPSIDTLIMSIDTLAHLAERDGNPHDLVVLIDQLRHLTDTLKNNSPDSQCVSE